MSKKEYKNESNNGDAIAILDKTQSSIEHTSLDLDNTPLSPEEEADLAEYEKTIAEGSQTFLKVGMALIEINKRRLYRKQYATFEEYCRKKWNFSRTYGYFLMESANTCEALSTMVDSDRDGTVVLPSTERQVRALSGLTEDEKKDVWGKAVRNAGGKAPTGKQVLDEKEKVKPKVMKVVKEKEEETPATANELSESSELSDGNEAYKQLEAVADFLVHFWKCNKGLTKLEKDKWNTRLSKITDVLKKIPLLV